MQRQTRKGLTLTGNYYDISLWSCVEVNIAIVSACLPTMRPLAQKMFPAAFISRVFSSRRNQFQKAGPTERGEEFQRLPDHNPEAAPGELHALSPEAELQGLVPEVAPRELQAPARYELAPNSDVDEFELGEVADTQSRITVYNLLR